MNVPKLRFPGFVGEWEEGDLGNLFTIFNGYAFSSTDSSHEGIPWVKIADVGIQEMKKDNLSFLPKSFIDDYSKFRLIKGDVVVALTRPILNGKLKIAVIDDQFNNSLLNQRVGKILSKNDTMFCYFVLQLDLNVKLIENNIAGSDPPNLSPQEIKSILVSFPSLEEQQKIATFLSSIDNVIQLLTKKKTLLENYKKGIMQKIFSQEIRFKDEDGNDFPDWEDKRLGECGKFISGSGFNDLEQGGKCGIPFYKVSDMNLPENKSEMFVANNYVTKQQIEQCNYKVVKNPSIIFAKVGAAIYLERKRIALNFCIDNNMMAYSPSGMIGFYYHLLNQIKFSLFAQVGALPSYNASDLSIIKVLIPSLPEQQKIADFLSGIDRTIEIVNSQIEKTKEYKKGLLQQMFV